jgi:putative GTP pyrophosphokinase
MQTMLPPSELSKNQIDRLGDRLRAGDISDDDLRLLDTYRRSFSDAYETVVGQIRDRLVLEPTGRPAKSTTSIIDKLQRESIRLSQMQDISGCRLTVADLMDQDEVVRKLMMLFAKATVVDRRDRPSHGYRAVHVIVEVDERVIEIQVRTSLQHLWAEVSEKLSDVVDPAIKYGGGGDVSVSFLAPASHEIMFLELTEWELRHVLASARDNDDASSVTKQKIAEARELLSSRKGNVIKLLNLLRDLAPQLKVPHDDFSN